MLELLADLVELYTYHNSVNFVLEKLINTNIYVVYFSALSWLKASLVILIKMCCVHTNLQLQCIQQLIPSLNRWYYPKYSHFLIITEMGGTLLSSSLTALFKDQGTKGWRLHVTCPRCFPCKWPCWPRSPILSQFSSTSVTPQGLPAVIHSPILFVSVGFLLLSGSSETMYSC